MRSPTRHLVLTATVVALAACSDDSVSPSSLTEAEAQELVGAIFSQSFVQALGYQSAPAQIPDGPAMATISETVEAAAPCPGGGEVSVTGSVDGQTDDQTGAGQIDFTMSLVHASCVVQGDQGTQFTLTGDPGLDFDFTMTTDGEQNASFSGSILGGVAWSTVSKQGSTCSFSYDFSGESSQTGFSFQTSGSVCGIEVDHNLSISG